MGEMNGPIKTRAENPAIAMPRVSFPNKSENAPPTTARGQDAKTPAKKRHSMRVCKSFAVAAANMKQVKTKQAPVKGNFLPYNSERGPNARGPVAKPQM